MSGFYSSALQLNKYWMNKELIDSLESVTAEKLQAFIDDEYFSQMSIESLLMVNLTAQGCCLKKILYQNLRPIYKFHLFYFHIDIVLDKTLKGIHGVHLDNRKVFSCTKS